MSCCWIYRLVRLALPNPLGHYSFPFGAVSFHKEGIGSPTSALWITLLCMVSHSKALWRAQKYHSLYAVKKASALKCLLTVCLMWFASQQQGRKHSSSFSVILKVLKVSHENQTGSVLLKQPKDSSCLKSWAAEGWSWGDQTGETAERNKKRWGKREFLTFCVRTEGGQVRGKFCSHCKPKDWRWTEVTHQQAPERLETRPSPTSITLLANRIAASFLEEKNMSLSSCTFLFWRIRWKGYGRCCRNGVSAPSRGDAVSPEEPGAGSRASRQCYGEPQSVTPGPGRPP